MNVLENPNDTLLPDGLESPMDESLTSKDCMLEQVASDWEHFTMHTFDAFPC